MNLIELFAPKGFLSPTQRQQLSERLVTELISAPGLPAGVLQRTRDMTSLVIHEPETWTVGGQPVAATDSPRYLVRVSTPAGHLNDQMRAEFMSRLTRVLAEVDADPDRFYREPVAWVQIVEVPDGNLGSFGRVMRTADIVRLAVTSELPEQAAVGEDASVDQAVDPICSMTVTLTQDAIVVEQDGARYAFCSTSCRDSFLATTPSRT